MSEPVKKSFLTRVVEMTIPLLVNQFIDMLLKNVGGFKLWFLKKLYQYGGRKLIKFLAESLHDFDQSLEDKKTTDKYEQVVENPDATRDERKQSENNLLNG